MGLCMGLCIEFMRKAMRIVKNLQKACPSLDAGHIRYWVWDAHLFMLNIFPKQLEALPFQSSEWLESIILALQNTGSQYPKFAFFVC